MTGLYDALTHDHQRLDAIFETLLNRVHAGDVEASREAWTRFERGLEAHLAAEERTLLPLFDAHDPDEAAAIRREHIEIRRLLAEMGVSLDLHVLREEKVAAFVEALRRHAAREEASLYPWADQKLPAPELHTLRESLGEAWKHVTERLKEGPPVI